MSGWMPWTVNRILEAVLLMSFVVYLHLLLVRPMDLFSEFVVFLLSSTLIMPCSVILHEIGHSLAICLIGGEVKSISLGYYNQPRGFFIVVKVGFPFYLYGPPFSGSVQFSYNKGRLNAKNEFLIILGGLLSTMTFCVLGGIGSLLLSWPDKIVSFSLFGINLLIMFLAFMSSNPKHDGSRLIALWRKLQLEAKTNKLLKVTYSSDNILEHNPAEMNAERAIDIVKSFYPKSRNVGRDFDAIQKSEAVLFILCNWKLVGDHCEKASKMVISQSGRAKALTDRAYLLLASEESFRTLIALHYNNAIQILTLTEKRALCSAIVRLCEQTDLTGKALELRISQVESLLTNWLARRQPIDCDK